ncbi:hypothetical protein AtubIFM55763_001287 [Aspergillus tubingensis]|nr:hypothetical protein AtubIFM55763_001287 [Aspergillus tubingensis]GLA95918.1 hypothetical protein AtubIFM57143_002939 [Aspergillus tubingensis]
MQAEPRKLKRTANACLRELQTQAKEQHETTKKRTHDVAFEEVENVLGSESRSPGANWPSPFGLPSMTMRNTHDNRLSRWIWLAPTSTWSFTARLTLMMSQRLHPDVAYDIPYYLDGDIYPLQWKSSSDAAPDISGLPSMDYALYLFNTVKFHLGQTFRLLDEETFTTHMQEFYYGDATKKATDSRLWFIQFLLVLSFGKAFLDQSKKRDPPGAAYFVRAMSLMPDYSSIWRDTLLAIEVMALAALYLYSIDRRESGHLFASQAIRIAQLEGLHTELPEQELGAAAVDRCRNLWWTLTERRPIESFIEKTKTILNTMADLARELEDFINTKFAGPVNSMSKGMRHILLLYHECVIVATRPLLLAVLRERLDKLGLPLECCRRIVPLMETLMSTGINSATKSLQLLKALVDEGLLESYLPFDLEFTYGAAIHLTMASALVPELVGQRSSNQQAHLILDEIISKGNRVAEIRKADLTRLETLFEGLKERYANAANHISTALVPETSDDAHEQDHRPNDNTQLPFITGDINVSEDELPELGLTSYDIAAIVDQIDYNASPSFWLAQEGDDL